MAAVALAGAGLRRHIHAELVPPRLRTLAEGWQEWNSVHEGAGDMCTRDVNVRLEISPRPDSRVAPSLAMSNDAAAERGSQPAQRDELAHSHLVPMFVAGFHLPRTLPHLL